jgi:hypothetical protein
VKEQTIVRRKIIISSHPTSGESKQVHSLLIKPSWPVKECEKVYKLFR